MSKNPDKALTEAEDELIATLRPQLDRLPIFPLSRVQLFPFSLLPLYVFEARYREMTAACLERGGAMAVAALIPGNEAEYEGRPPVRPVAGAGLVVAHRKNPDGTYNILLRGASRVRITDELPPDRAFREVRAVLIPDEVPIDFDDATSRETLCFLVDRLAHFVPNGGDSLRELCRDISQAGQMADVLAAALVQSPSLRQELLETPCISTRLERVASEVARLLSVATRRSAEAN